ncbi:MAG: EamA family transporter [Oscillospiraceae bacterium]
MNRIIPAVLSALFAGITSVLVKIGVKTTDSDVATAIRTIVVLIFSWIIVFIAGTQSEITQIDSKTWVFLILSGLATGASWLCCYKALQIGDVNKVTPVDKSSSVLVIILAAIFLGESLTLLQAAGVVLIAAGTFLMIAKKETAEHEKNGRGWFFYAALSAVFAALTSILGKIGINGVNSNLGTALRTGVVLVMAWLCAGVKGKLPLIKKINRKELVFILLSGVSTGASWLCYFRALKFGRAGAVASIDKLSIVFTVIFSRIAFGEKLSKKASAGLCALIAGTLMLMRNS